ncbi:periplasmic binding protein [Mycobacterium haemophilum DSM 44634]|uniref:ABC transporter substrate-binding protein n=1 Tax=Mycobacterium haemophilum TaxID=29311 RepID=UPI0006564160|nr:ABC transporter substrate-binding protein [Mycobacterium haemophilum]AKN18108.1 ABC transporter substrate-binding protein [Mycobacterium haemophilum DSM 44634]MCV7340928.1 ABC transporter substrate-binding protein [Mycobacterium haemophilum DSM 44634]
MPRPPWAALTVATSLTLAVAGCASPAGPSDTNAAPDAGCLTDFSPDTDYFPDKVTVTDATNFTISYHNSYQILTVKHPYPGGSPESYVLVRCGAPAPKLTGDLAHAQQITVPVTRLYSASTTHLGMITELEQTDVLAGVAETANVVNPQLRRRVTAGKIAEYAPGQQVNVEAVIAGHPDVLVTQGVDDPSYAKLRDAGVDVVADAEWLEATPLGRAEWVKVFAALTGTEKKAAELYNQLRGDYHTMANKTAKMQPTQVLPGTLSQGAWSVPAGGDYAGRLIVDAGGSYPWADYQRTGNLQLSFESVYAEAGQAPVCLVTSDWKTLDEALAADNRYGELAAVRTGQVWSATKAIGPGGGNDYWERGVARPDLVLGDLVAILHPELAANHPFEFYRQVPRR